MELTGALYCKCSPQLLFVSITSCEAEEETLHSTGKRKEGKPLTRGSGHSSCQASFFFLAVELLVLQKRSSVN